LLVLPDHLLVLLLVGRHVDQLLLDLSEDLYADARSAHLLEVAQDVQLGRDDNGEVLNKKVDLSLSGAAAWRLFDDEVEKVQDVL